MICYRLRVARARPREDGVVQNLYGTERRSTQSREIKDDITRIKVVRNEVDTRRSRLATRSEYSDKLASNRITGSYVAEPELDMTMALERLIIWGTRQSPEFINCEGNEGGGGDQ